MSIKSTQTISRAHAIRLLMLEIDGLPNEFIATLLDKIADSGYSRYVSYFDNFLVYDTVDEEVENV